MKKPSDPDPAEDFLSGLIGLGERSFHKSYYPELQRRLSELERFRTLLDQGNDAIFLVHLTTQRLLDVNESACRLLGYSRDELLSAPLHDPLLAPALENLTALLSDEDAAPGMRKIASTELLRRDAEALPVEITLRFVPFDDELYAVAAARDITERKKVEEQMRRLAYYDRMTDLPNRILFEEHLRQWLPRVREEEEKAALLLLDLDRFKEINAALGHGSGDRMLHAFAQRLKEGLRGKNDIAARMAGDEFALFLHPVEDLKMVVRIARSLLLLLSSPFSLDGHDVILSACIGVALFPGDGSDEQTLLRHADLAMYAAKSRGRNTYQFFSGEMNRRAKDRREIEENLRKGLRLREFSLVYQPQCDLESGKVVGAEALLRWQRDGQSIPPDLFIPIAEETGAIRVIGEWVLEAACRQACRWHRAGLPLKMAVNISAVQFRQPDFVDILDRILAETGISPSLLELELTESAFMEDTEVAVQTLVDLRSRGVHLAIDDFGTGYSSLSYLKYFPINSLKIDRSFIREVPRNSDDVAIVQAIIAMARHLKLQVVAEGVETREHVDFLRTHQCHRMQGYFFGRPMPPEEFVRCAGVAEVNLRGLRKL